MCFSSLPFFLPIPTSQSLNVSQFELFVTLEFLDLNSNSLSVLQCEWFDALHSLKTLLIEGNGIKKIVGTFKLPALDVIWYVVLARSVSSTPLSSIRSLIPITGLATNI
jgi:hypothetical protein